MRRLAILTVMLVTLFALSAAPALAHFNDAAGKPVGPPGHAEPEGLGHIGMECGAEVEQTPLQTLGLACPAQR